MREEFEAWCERESVSRYGGMRWALWQAAYAAGRLAGMEEAAVIAHAAFHRAADGDEICDEIREAAKP